MGDTPFDKREYDNELDEIAAGVMPNSWIGHARIRAHEENLTPKQEEFFLTLTQRIAEKKGLPVTEVTDATLAKTLEVA